MSNKKVLTAVDLVGIQRFIFSSNRLSDVAGASYLVNLATPRQGDPIAMGAINACGAAHAVIVSGGGNAVLEFEGADAWEQARTFAACYSRWLIDKAPGLDAVIVHKEYGIGFAEALDRLLKETATAKFERAPSAPLLGLSVTAACRETGLPANDESADGEPIAQSIKLIRAASMNARDYWNDFLLSNCTVGDDHLPVFPVELDDMGRSEGQTSLIGVVHIDGNGVGRKIIDWLEEAKEENIDDDVVKTQYRAWSGAIDALGTKLLKSIVQRVTDRVKPPPQWAELQGKPESLSFRLKCNANEVFLPIRPVILGGDDITFLCDGRIALDLAAAALDVFRADNDIAHLGRIGACAGVAIVHAHAPILRAWSLAEELCRSAKRKIRESKQVGFALDWHIGLPAPGQSIEDVRRKQYKAGNLDLTCRPVVLGDSGQPKPETWKWIDASLLADEDGSTNSLRGPLWREHRNKVKQLAPLARIGPDELKRTLDAWRVVEKKLELPEEIANGFIGDTRTPLLDASELLDVHLSLQ